MKGVPAGIGGKCRIGPVLPGTSLPAPAATAETKSPANSPGNMAPPDAGITDHLRSVFRSGVCLSGGPGITVSLLTVPEVRSMAITSTINSPVGLNMAGTRGGSIATGTTTATGTTADITWPEVNRITDTIVATAITATTAITLPAVVTGTTGTIAITAMSSPVADTGITVATTAIMGITSPAVATVTVGPIALTGTTATTTAMNSPVADTGITAATTAIMGITWPAVATGTIATTATTTTATSSPVADMGIMAAATAIMGIALPAVATGITGINATTATTTTATSSPVADMGITAATTAIMGITLPAVATGITGINATTGTTATTTTSTPVADTDMAARGIMDIMDRRATINSPVGTQGPIGTRSMANLADIGVLKEGRTAAAKVIVAEIEPSRL
jgi:hypothetical protein